MDEQNDEHLYQMLVDKVYERCQEVQLENERLVFRTNKIKKQVQHCGRDIELLKRRLDRYNDNWRSLPMVLPHPKRKIEQKRGPKPKGKTVDSNISSQDILKNDNADGGGDGLKKARKQRVRKSDKNVSLQQQEATLLLRQEQQQKRQELQRQRQREQQAIKLAAQQERQLLRQQKQIAAQQLKQQRQLQRQQQRFNMQQQKRQVNSPTIANTSNNSPPRGRFVTKVSTTFLTPQRNAQVVNTSQNTIGDIIMPPPPPPPKVDQYTDQQAQLLLMHRPLQITALKNQQKSKML